jgi:GAF domain-containing protein
MAYSKIRCAILGAQEQDLTLLSALHHRSDLEIALVYDRDRQAVGIDIAEILRIPRAHTPDQLVGLVEIDYAVVTEPREKFSAETEIFARAGVRILNPSELFQQLLSPLEEPKPSKPAVAEPWRTIDDTLVALERLFDRGELLKFLLGVAVEATSSSAGSIMLYSRDTDELFIAYATGLSERVIQRTRQRLGQGISGMVAQSRQPRLVTKPPDGQYYGESRERVDIGSAISVPLIWGERLLGVLNVSVGTRGRQLEEGDLQKLTSLSRRISRVLDQSVRLEEIQMRHREWKFRTTMGEIANKPISTEEKFSVLARYLSELVGGDSIEIFLATPEGDWFVLGGSNRLLTPKGARVRYQSAALSRSFLENRAIVLSEGGAGKGESFQAASSVVYCPLLGRDASGVIVGEFSERYKVDEFLLMRDAIILEISRFLASEMRERKLNRELRMLRALADAASSILSCRTMPNLAEVLASTTAVVLECERVSVRLREKLGEETYVESYFGVPAERVIEWRPDDHQRFLSLARDRKPAATAFLSFEPAVSIEPRQYRSVLAFPLQNEDGFFGGIIAYDKTPDDPLEDAIFSDVDRKVMTNLSGLAMPVLDSILRKGPAAGVAGVGGFEAGLPENLARFKQACSDEISRSERYHHTFTVLIFRVDALGASFEHDRKRAVNVIEDISRGLKSRTRKTDIGDWIGPDTYAILTLDGGKRIRFLVSRVTTYLSRDLSSLTDVPEEQKRILVGSASYPGTSKNADELLAEAFKNLKPLSST